MREAGELLGEAGRFLELAFEGFGREAWNAVAKATEALLASRGYASEEMKTYRVKRLKLEELAIKDSSVRKLELRDRFAAREHNLHIRCFYDGEYTVEGLREELEKAREYLELVRRTLANP